MKMRAKLVSGKVISSVFLYLAMIEVVLKSSLFALLGCIGFKFSAETLSALSHRDPAGCLIFYRFLASHCPIC